MLCARHTLLLDYILKDIGSSVLYKYTAKGRPMVTSAPVGKNPIEASYRIRMNKGSSMRDLSRRYESSMCQEAVKHISDEVERIQRYFGDVCVIRWSCNPRQRNSILFQVANNESSSYLAGAYISTSGQKLSVILLDSMANINNTTLNAAMLPFVASGRNL
ncbi:hypothetical protein FBU59_000255 [Linderina macrospora]|uniref:Uncharacterized protein n=1 Tax=Linderina macrospora TaxID=4868 RepID=A0ACC1JHL7_9FUNG|nr:hypothetical protein FBU59_000255 [Linderina macrospora]